MPCNSKRNTRRDTRCASHRTSPKSIIACTTGIACAFGALFALHGLAGSADARAGQPGTTSPETPRLIEPLVAPEALAIQSTINTLYAVISGPPGPRDWERFKSLFIEGATLTSLVPIAGEPPRIVRMSPDDYIARSGPVLEERGFFEREIGSTIDRFADMAHVWSTYETRFTPGGDPDARGINSIQLVKTGAGWKIASVLWSNESAANPIPSEYLPR